MKKLNLIVLIIIVTLFLYPIIVTVSNSFSSTVNIQNNYKTEANLFDKNKYNIHFVQMDLIPQDVSLEQYGEILFKTPTYLLLLLNSAKITFPVVLGQIVVSIMAAYAFETIKNKYKEILFFMYIVVMLMPLQVLLVPNYIVADILHINESYLAIILPGIFSPFGTFILRQHIKTIPKPYIEAARVDGASELYIFIKIIVPMCKPVIVTVLMLTFIEYWNIIDQAIVFIKENGKQPLSVFISTLSQESVGIIFASSCFYMIPSIIVFLYGQKYLVESAQLTGIKG